MEKKKYMQSTNPIFHEENVVPRYSFLKYRLIPFHIASLNLFFN